MPKYTKRKDGRYQARIYVGRNEENKKVFKYLYADNEKELKLLVSEYRIKQNKGIDLLTTNDSLEEWAKRLFNTCEYDMTESEYSTFKFRCNYFVDSIGSMPINTIRQGNINPLIKALFEKNPSTGKPSGKRTIERYLSALSRIFDYAIENRVIDFNPCNYVKIPKAAKTTERRALSLEERKWIEEMPHRAQLAAMLLMYSGLRRGEATALLWSDIDFKNKTITVNKSYDFKTFSIKEPKSEAGNRIVTVPSKLINFLMTVEKHSLYVLTTADGRMMTDVAWKKLWDSYICDLNIRYGKQTVKRSKFDPKGNIITIKPFTPHCLRHTFCTIMYEAGVDVMTAKEQMGHSDVKTTLEIYTHLDKIYKKKNISKLEEYLSSGT